MTTLISKFAILYSDSNKLLKSSVFKKLNTLMYSTSWKPVDIFDIHNQRSKSKTDDISEKEVKTKFLKVAIIGVPNVGKSTLINQIMGRHVCGVSSKVHTTKCRAKAVMIADETQIVFLDTPGIVTSTELQKHKMETSVLTDGELAVQEADVIGVMHDISNRYTRHKLDTKILRLLYLFQNKRSFLIINKVDTLKSKQQLLSCVQHLTNGTLQNPLKNSESPDLIHDPRINRDCTLNSVDNLKSELPLNRMTEAELQKCLEKAIGWSHFEDVFMVSALNGNGVGDIKMYLLDLAEPGEWVFSRTDVTDQEPVKFIEHTVFCKLLDNLPNEVPYNVEVMLEYYNVDQDDTVIAVVLVGCDTPRLEKVVMGSHGKRIKVIAQAAEEELRKFFMSDVRLKLVVTCKAAFRKARFFQSHAKAAQY